MARLSASLWGCELKLKDSIEPCLEGTSASLWGCELKWLRRTRMFFRFCQPLYEAVSWNKTKENGRDWADRQPLYEAVSWNIRKVEAIIAVCRQPLYEAVSWNVEWRKNIMENKKSASLWGCELKFPEIFVLNLLKSQPLYEAVSWNSHNLYINAEAVSQPLYEAVSWNALPRVYGDTR